LVQYGGTSAGTAHHVGGYCLGKVVEKTQAGYHVLFTRPMSDNITINLAVSSLQSDLFQTTNHWMERKVRKKYTWGYIDVIF
jgi:uncharacterized protein YycO